MARTEGTSPDPERVSLIELGPPSLGADEKDAIAAVLDSGWLTMGEHVRSFEAEFAALHGVDDAICVGSATAALQMSLQAFDVGPGDEVLVPSLTFVATANVVVHAGATPVFVDIDDPLVPHMSLADAERRLTERTKAITLVHYAGTTCDLPAWRDFADTHGLLLFEDAAHCAGMRGHGRLTEAAAFSFYSNKNMTTAEGGMLVVRDPERSDRARALRNHGLTASTLDRSSGRAAGYDVVDFGHNFRMDEIRAAIGRVQLTKLLAWNDARRAISARYRERLASAIPSVEVPFEGTRPTAAHIQPILLPLGTDRPKIASELRSARIQTSMHYPPIHRFDAYRRTYGERHLPTTEAFAARELTVPLHPKLTDDDVDRVVSSLADALASAR
ncbi:MAG: DegT/DnrJ/EryC1/StrS family aminotransferase [Candidatus Limnocylindrales bacterium]